MIRPSIFNKKNCVIGVLGYCCRIIWINLNNFYFSRAFNRVVSNFYTFNKHDPKEWASDTSRVLLCLD